MTAENTGTLTDPKILRNPSAFYASLRKDRPVCMMPGTDFYFVANYELATEILGNVIDYSNTFAEGETSFVNFDPDADRLLEEIGYGRRVPTFVFSDPPLHTTWRRIMAGALRPSVVKSMHAKIDEIVAFLLGEIREDGLHDLVEKMFVPLPMYILADWMGVNRDDYPRFKKWSLAANYTLQPPLPKATKLEYARSIAEMQHYLVAMMEVRRKAPREDLISDLLAVEFDGGRPLTDKEILSALETILVAGNETTTNAMGNALLLLSQDKDLERRLREDPALINAFVEEALRLETSVNGVFRRAVREVEVGGVAIPKDGKIFVGLASAGRDEAKFEDAEHVHLDRRKMRDHIAFGHGVHNCLGKDLARVEMVSFFRQFLEQFSEFSLAVPLDQVKYHPLMGLKGVAELPLNLKR